MGLSHRLCLTCIRETRLACYILKCSSICALLDIKKCSHRCFFPVNAYRVSLPPLRERQDDIPLLLGRFLDEAATSLNKSKPTVSPQLIPLLQRYAFPGNIRELRAMIFEAVSLHRKGVLGLASFQAAIGGTIDLSSDLDSSAPTTESGLSDAISYPEQLPTLKESADLLVDEAMRRAHQNQTQAARLLGISRPALSKRLKNRP